jgi:membrane protein implicated in regulation of membrane protease activity
MLAWLNSNVAYWHWMVFGLILVSGEMLLPSFVLLWFGISALIVGGLLWYFEITFTIQLVIWVLLSLLNVFVWFKWISPLLRTKSLSGMARESMIGQIGTVIEYNSVQPGRGKLRFPAPIVGSDEWRFICVDDIKVGSRVIVREFSGNTLIVNKA